MTVAKRGMHGYTVAPGTPIMEAAKLWDPEELLAGPGIVDYVVGAAPGPGRLRARHHRAPAPAPLPQPLQARRGADLLLLHALPPLPFRGADHDRPRRRCSATPTIAPIGAPLVEVVTMAKRDLAGRRGDRRARRLHASTARPRTPAITARENLLPIGVADRREAEARGPEGRGADLRRRRAARRPAGRPAARRAGRDVRPQARGGLRPARAARAEDDPGAFGRREEVAMARLLHGHAGRQTGQCPSGEWRAALSRRLYLNRHMRQVVNVGQLGAVVRRSFGAR